MSLDLVSTREFPQTTSFVLLLLKETQPGLYPKEVVACMNCPLAVWMATTKALNCYCRVLYKVMWETSAPGKMQICDGPEQARLAAEGQAQSVEIKQQASSKPLQNQQAQEEYFFL